jgi:hypothetical protein
MKFILEFSTPGNRVLEDIVRPCAKITLPVEPLLPPRALPLGDSPACLSEEVWKDSLE